MKKFLLCILGSMVCNVSLWAASYIYTPFETQMRDSDVAVLAKVRDSHYKKLASGEVVTEYILETKWKAGEQGKNPFHASGLKFLVPGGEWQDVNYRVSGAPQFEPGEDVFVFLKDTPAGHVILNLGLGKYQVKSDGPDKYLESSVFPQHPELGEFPLDKMKELALSHYSKVTDYSKKKQDNTIVKFNQSNDPFSRSPASLRQESTKRKPATDNGPSQRGGLFWPFFILCILASLKAVVRLGHKR